MAQKKSKSNRVNAKKQQWLRLPELSTKTARLVLFVLIFANIGVYYLSYGRATTYNVRFIYFCAKDVCSTARSASTVDSYGNQVRSWYGSHLGRTFTKTTTVKVTGTQYASYYNGSYDVTTGAASEETIRRVRTDLANFYPDSAYTKNVVVLGFRSMGNCGIGWLHGNIAVSDPQKGCSSIQPSVLGQELGHTFGVSPTSNLHRTDGSLMDDYACNGNALSSCGLNSSDRSWLLSNHSGTGWSYTYTYWLPNVYSTSTTTTTTSTTNPYSQYCASGSEPTVGYGYTTSGNCVKKLQWGLNKNLGTSLVIDGAFGNNTYNATKQFQSKYGLTADGIAGRNTWNKMDSLYK